ncbi:MAG TPA: hypothetical protein VFV34_05990 [Blastocatellia bacterium]|nr:hypothetical protein [Blastocatellia bacterium]
MPGKETKIFDPADGYAPLTDAFAITDSTVVKRDNRWWMYLGGVARGKPATQLFSASLPEGAPLAATGWRVTPDSTDKTRIGLLAGQENSKAWDMKGGRHCPSYVRGWDPLRRAWVERIYYAGGADNIQGPYTIGYLEWDGGKWIDQEAPVFTGSEDWEHRSVYEPNLVYHDGKWRMWYVAGSNQEDYLVHGYSESVDGRSNWTKHQIVFPPEEKVFDFSVIKTAKGFEAVFSRVWLGKPPAPAKTGLWWCHAKAPSPRMSDWSAPVQIMTGEDRGWHVGPWKPSLQYGEAGPNKMFVFFDGIYMKKEPGPFPYAFTLGCLEIPRPD